MQAPCVSAFTKTALDGGRDMGLTSEEMLDVVASLTRRNFYKSMTTYSDHRVWQDDYHAPTPIGKEAYMKITMRDAAPVIQFKERGDEDSNVRELRSFGLCPVPRGDISDFAQRCRG